MADLSSELDQAFDATMSEGTSSAEPEAPAKETAQPEPAASEPGREATPKEPQLEETGDVLLDKLTPEQIAEIKSDPRLRALYKGLMSSYTPKMQALSEQQRLWDALSNEQTRAQAVRALAATVGLEIKPTDQPQRDQATSVADKLSEQWSTVVGPEAAQMLRPLIEQTALAAINGTLQPLQQATEYLQLDAKARQAEAQVSQFRAVCEKEGWDWNPSIEAKVAQMGARYGRPGSIQTVEEGVSFLKDMYRLANSDGQESKIEARILERMNKAAKEQEPGRGVPSTGREKRTAITKEMDLSQALETAFEEEVGPIR